MDTKHVALRDTGEVATKGADKPSARHLPPKVRKAVCQQNSFILLVVVRQKGGVRWCVEIAKQLVHHSLHGMVIKGEEGHNG